MLSVPPIGRLIMASRPGRRMRCLRDFGAVVAGEMVSKGLPSSVTITPSCRLVSRSHSPVRGVEFLEEDGFHAGTIGGCG